MRTLPLAILLLSVPSVAAPYDKMFEVGTTMTYDESDSVSYGGAAPKQTSLRATCRVATVTKIAGVNVASIECDTRSSIAGYWMANRRGLWTLHDATAEHVKRTLREPPLIAARPSRRVRDTRMGWGTGERTVVVKKDGRWCVETEYGDPNGSITTTYCFAGGLVVERSSDGMWYSEGGGESTSRAVLVPPG